MTVDVRREALEMIVSVASNMQCDLRTTPNPGAQMCALGLVVKHVVDV